MNIAQLLAEKTVEAVDVLFSSEINASQVQIQKTLKTYTGDLTVVVFPFLKMSKKSPEQTAELIGRYLQEKLDCIAGYNVVKAFLNLSIRDGYYIDFLNEIKQNPTFGTHVQANQTPVVVEYSSPNTNKPLHLGHVRNNLLGWSVCEILKAAGYAVKKVNLVNDRGIHICKSMVAWKNFGKGETPESARMKGDSLVGKYYVLFNDIYKKEVDELLKTGLPEEEAEKKAPILLEAQKMLRDWESGDESVRKLWSTMNQWVYEGFAETYQKMGVDFDKIYYESETYLLGKSIVEEGLQAGLLIRKDDGSVWIDLRSEGLDEKLLLRSDGTSVYMTQDLGTAVERFADFSPQKMIYVVGNEQNYHFEVLKILLSKLGYTWASCVEHLSYGMVELPEGKMKSREGTVVDADDLITEMSDTARQMTEELGKIDLFSPEEAKKLYHEIGMGALKYFILKVDPQKNMLFNPKSSIDFNGNTGPFIQYTHARICSLLRKAGTNVGDMTFKPDFTLQEKEKAVLMLLHDYPAVVSQAAATYSPALIANYVYDLAKTFNGFYQDTPVLKETDENIRVFRLTLSAAVKDVIKSALALLGIAAPERM